MAQLNMDIDKWKADYPFLENAWEKYEKFEKAVEENDDLYVLYAATCKLIIWRTVSDTSKYNDFCMKLIRNLGAHSTDQKIINPSGERCNDIHSWLYYLIMKHNIPSKFIQESFRESKPPDGIGVKNNICTYYPYEKFINVADDMLKINIFVDNVSTIRNILKDTTHKYNCLGRKFLYECFNIYKKINGTYCSNGRKNDTINICPQLELFSSHYHTFIPPISEIPAEIKSLNAEGIQFKDICPLNESKTETVSDGVHSTGSSGPSNTTTALSTVVGASSALALLYKYTPAGRWINFGLHGVRRGVNNNLYGDEGNEMLFDGNVNSEFNSFNIGYEAA